MCIEATDFQTVDIAARSVPTQACVTCFVLSASTGALYKRQNASASLVSNPFCILSAPTAVTPLLQNNTKRNEIETFKLRSSIRQEKLRMEGMHVTKAYD
jgi:hypothetical protein